MRGRAQADHALALPQRALDSDRVRLTTTALEIHGDLTQDEWMAVGQTLRRLEGAALWWVGDWWAYGDRQWGDGEEAAAAVGYEYGTAMNAGSVARAFEFSRRRENLTWGHHQTVAVLAPAEQDELLDWCEAGENGQPRPIRELRNELIRRRRARARADARELPAGTFRVIYADPPWSYSDERAGLTVREVGGVNRASTAARHHYPTMTTDEICAVNVAERTQADAVLFCWATFPLLPDGIRVVEAWGFTYKTAFVWAKPRGSFGHYHKADAEVLLLATRGSCTPDSADTRVSQVISAAVDGHSRKPAAFRALIESLYFPGPYLELFARSAAPGWQSWGNEA